MFLTRLYFPEGLGRPFEKVGELRANYPFGLYTNYATMLRYLRTLDFYYPHIVQLVQIGKTHEGRSIEGVKVGILWPRAILSYIHCFIRSDILQTIPQESGRFGSTEM